MVGYSKANGGYFVYEETTPQEFCAIKGPFASRLEAETAMRDQNAELITPMIIGPIIYFKLNKLFYKDLLTISSDADYDFYIKSEFTIHLQKTIKALLLHEN